MLFCSKIMPLPDDSGQNSPEFTKLSNEISGDFSGAKCQTWGAIRFNRGIYRLTAITQDVNVARNSIGQTGYWLADIVQSPDNH